MLCCAGGSLSESVSSAASVTAHSELSDSVLQLQCYVVHECVFYELSMVRSSVVNIYCVWEVNWIKPKDVGIIFSSSNSRSAVQIFSLMIPLVSIATLQWGLQISLAFLSLVPLSFEDGRGVGVLALMDFVVWFCLVLRCTNLYMYHFRFMAHRISVLIENALIIGFFMCIIIERISVVMNIPFNRYQGCNWFHSYTTLNIQIDKEHKYTHKSTQIKIIYLFYYWIFICESI